MRGAGRAHPGRRKGLSREAGRRQDLSGDCVFGEKLKLIPDQADQIGFILTLAFSDFWDIPKCTFGDPEIN